MFFSTCAALSLRTSPEKPEKTTKNFELKATDIQLRTLLPEQGWWNITMKCYVISQKTHAVCKTFDTHQKYQEERDGALKVSAVSSRFFVKFLGYSPESETVAYEIAKGVSLRTFAMRNKEFEPRNLVALRVLRDLGSAIVALNQKGFVHQDIKADNVVALIEKQKTTGRFVYKGLKVIDFGNVKEKTAQDLDGGSRAFVPIQKNSPNKDFFSVVMVFGFMLNYLRISTVNPLKYDHKFPNQSTDTDKYKDETYKKELQFLEDGWVHIDEEAWVYWSHAKAQAAVLEIAAENEVHALFKKMFEATYEKGCEANVFRNFLKEVRLLIQKLVKEAKESATVLK